MDGSVNVVEGDGRRARRADDRSVPQAIAEDAAGAHFDADEAAADGARE